MTTKKITIGCDPEVFVKNNSDGSFVSAYGLLPGNKEKPHPVPKGAIQIDGMACEFNTDPATTREEFVNNVQTVFTEMQKRLPLDVSPAVGVPVAHFSPEIYSAQPLEALELGCEPDYCAYTVAPNPRPDVSTGTMRTAAGHIHIGFTDRLILDPLADEEHMETCRSLVKFLDATIGVASLRYDKDVERRSLYGAAGAFRPKPYGVEYRVLSNAWLSSDNLIGDIFDSTVTATQQWLESPEVPDFMYDHARDIINNSRFELVKDFQEEFYRQLSA